MKFNVWRRRRYRHPCDKGSPAQRALGAAFRFLLNQRTWKRHSDPFSKTKRGQQRRSERRFVLGNKRLIEA